MRPVARKLSDAEKKIFNEAASKQTGKARTPKTTNPEKYPIFDIPVCEKRLIYVPKLVTTVELEDGGFAEELLMDKGAFHGVRHRGTFTRFRCNAGITGVEGFDGSCVFDEVMSECWDLYNKQVEAVAEKYGVDHTTEEGKKRIEKERKEFLQEMAVSNAEVRYTFPIFVVETKKGTLDPVTDESGSIQGRLEWYQIAEKTYKDKWASTFEALPAGAAKHPGGRWYILDYYYTAENGKPTKMQSASNLKVLHKDMGEAYAQLNAYLDNLAAEWTPDLAREVIYENQIYANEDLKPIVDEVMSATRSKLLAYQTAGKAVGIGVAPSPALGVAQGSPEDIAKSFGAVPNVGAIPAPVGIPNPMQSN